MFQLDSTVLHLLSRGILETTALRGRQMNGMCLDVPKFVLYLFPKHSRL